MGSVFRRFYRMRPLSALLLCLPGILLVVWYSWEAASSFDRYRRMAKAENELNVEEFQLQLFDVLRRDLRRLTMPSTPKSSKLRKLAFHVSPENLTKLYEGAAIDTGRPYVSGSLERKNKSKLLKLELRLRGSRHWHHLGRQKSFKVRLPKGKLVDGYRIFNLINDPVPMIPGEQLILDVARKKGVLTPESSFARVELNGADLGVFRYETQPDESLLRMSELVPGSLYSGNLPGSAKTEELWEGTPRWRKSAWRIDDEEHDFEELGRFLENLRGMTARQFVGFARAEIDLEAFATFDALDVAFGGNQHDFRQNHKLHYDPYRGRWAPVAWNFRGFQHDPLFNLTENPILLRLKLVPEYLTMRNRILNDLLVGSCSVSKVRKRGRKILKKLAPELATDRYFDAYKLLPRVDRFHRQMVRPMDLARAALVFESELTTYRRRHAFLARELKRNPLWIRVGQSAETGDEEHREVTTTVDLIVDGRAGIELSGFRTRWPADCAEIGWRVEEQGAQITPRSDDGEVELLAPRTIYPSVGFVPRERGASKRGAVRTSMLPTVSRFVVRSGCAPEKIEARGVYLATGSRIRSRPATKELEAKIPDDTLGADDVPRFVPGEVSPHPDTLRPPPAESVVLGPGTVSVPETRIFGAHQSVVVEAGTRFEMGADASLVFLGKVELHGTEARPINLAGVDGSPWGGVVLQGPATRGSSLSHVVIRGGTVPSYRAIPYPGMLNIHDTRDITLTDCALGSNDISDDVLHATYVEDLFLTRTAVTDAFSDALDLEFTSSTLRNVTAYRVGDDAVDVMGGEITVADSVFVDCSGYGISAGEESRVKVLDSLVARSKAGVLAKNAATVELSDSLIYKNKIGVRAYKQTARYVGTSEVSADLLFIVGCKKLTKLDDESKNAVKIDRILRRLPGDDTLAHLMEDVLGLDAWSRLEGFLDSVTAGGVR